MRHFEEFRSEQWEAELKQALASPQEPSEALNQQILFQIKERTAMPINKTKKRFTAIITIALTLAISATAYAAWNLLTPNEVVQHMGDKTLAEAFAQQNVLTDYQSATAGGYQFDFLGVVTGQGLSDYQSDSLMIASDRTYAIVSISRTDGQPMPSTHDAHYNEQPFLITPLVSGLAPWEFSIYSMNGGYQDIVEDGVQYRLIECDNVAPFADRALYLGIIGETFLDNTAFDYNQTTGEISVNPAYEGINILFSLPLSKDLADPVKAAQYLEEINDQSSPDTSEGEEDPSNLIALMTEKTLISDSVKEITFDQNGMGEYSYINKEKGIEWETALQLDSLFTEGQTGFSDSFVISGEDDERLGMRFFRNENGTITGQIYQLP